MSVQGPVTVDSILAQPGQSMAKAHDQVISQVDQDEYEYVGSSSVRCGHDIQVLMKIAAMSPFHRTSRWQRIWPRVHSRGSQYA